MAVKEKVQLKEFVECLSYPSKKSRPLGKWPLSVPRDPLISDYTQIKGKKTIPEKYFYSLYFTVFDVRDYGPEIKKFMKIFSNMAVKKVYLETYRDGCTADEKVLKTAKKALEKEGIKVSGGITTTHFSDKTKYNETVSAAGCYTDKNANRALKKTVEFTAKIFNEIIIDDWFFTVCMCPECKKARQGRTWAEYRSKLMYDTAKKYIIEPAKKTNKKALLVLKLPQWYEEYYEKGYDITRLTEIFDELAVGTESRDLKKGRYMPVHGGMLYRYIKETAPDKVKKAWFDIYMTDSNIYVEQAYQSVMGGAEEIILFCAGIMPQKEMRPMVEALIENTPKMGRLRDLHKIFKVPVIRKPNTSGDDKLHQYFLMLGIPIFLTEKMKFEERIVILTEQSGKKTEYTKLFNHFLKEKKDIVLTAGVAKEIKKYFNFKKLAKPVKGEQIKYTGRQNSIKGKVVIDSEITGGKHLALINGAYPFLTFFKIKNSKVFVLSLPEETSTITDITGDKQSADYRYLVKTLGMADAVRNIFKNYANVLLFDRIKTYYKYNL
ncbi:MAG: hypothetical protein ACLFP1_06530 [Candidatus Goldiibacteriota bacterium]